MSPYGRTYLSRSKALAWKRYALSQVCWLHKPPGKGYLCLCGMLPFAAVKSSNMAVGWGAGLLAGRAEPSPFPLQYLICSP